MVEATTPSASISVRIVPGAPPPVPPTKSQLKKRKQKTAKARTSGEEGLDSSRDTAPADPVPNSNSLGGTEEEKKTTEAGPEPELALHPSTIALEGQKPPSPIVDQIINRRIKALGKKIQRIALHSSKPESTLNEDQKRSIASLPNLEASLKELEEIKKGIEVLEHEQAEKQAALRAAEVKETEQRIADAVSYAESKSIIRTRSLVAFLALSTLLVTPIPLAPDQIGDHRVPTDEIERNVIIEAGRTLLTPEFGSGEKDQLLKAILGIQLEGSFMDIPYDRLREIVQQFIHPTTPIPSAPSSPPLVASTNFPEEATLSVEDVSTPTTAQPLSHPIVPSGSGLTTTSSFQFMSESDLDLEPVQEYASTDQARSTGWVHIDEISPLHHEEVDPNLNGGVMSEEVHNLVEEEVEEIQAQELGSGETPIESVPAEPEQATLDWAADEGGLPSLSALENSFGKSGAATPVAPSSSTLPNYLPPHQFAHTNGDSRASPNPREITPEQGSGTRPQQQQSSQVQLDPDGFMSIQGRRARGGFRGGDRSHRGRGSWDGRGGYGGPRGGGGGDRGGRRGGGPGNEQGGFANSGNERGPNGAGEPTPGAESYRGRGGPRGGRGPPPDFGGNGSYNGSGGRGRGGYNNGDYRGGGGYRNHGEEDGGRGRGRGRGGGGPHRGARGFPETRAGPPPEA